MRCNGFEEHTIFTLVIRNGSSSLLWASSSNLFLFFCITCPTASSESWVIEISKSKCQAFFNLPSKLQPSTDSFKSESVRQRLYLFRSWKLRLMDAWCFHIPYIYIHTYVCFHIPYVCVCVWQGSIAQKSQSYMHALEKLSHIFIRTWSAKPYILHHSL